MAIEWLLLLLVATTGWRMVCSQTSSFNYQQVVEVNVNAAVGSVLGTVGTGVVDLQLPFKQVYYLDDGGSDVFNISLADGKIILLKSLVGLTTSKYNFVCRSNNEFIIQVTVDVTGRNYGGPVFNPNMLTFDIPESAPLNSKYPLGAASSPNNIINFTRSYAIVSGNIDNVFGLTTTYVADGSLYVNLIVVGQLDHEVTPYYNLTIAAYDGSVPPQVGYLQVNINIINVNDNQPVFSQSRYFAQVFENVSIGTTVAWVSATDKDTGSSSQISYSVDKTRCASTCNFDVNSSGGIYVVSALDYETTPSYELIVLATKGGSTGLAATAVVVITVININDRPPVINVAFLTDDGSSNIPESVEPGSYVAQISVTDPEMPSISSWCNVTMKGGNGYFGLEVQDGQISWIKLVTPLDREKQSIFLLVVTAVDKGTPPLTSTSNITVTIVADVGPIINFMQSVYFAEVLQSADSNTLLTTVTATSSDPASLVRYQLTNISLPILACTVDAVSGRVSTAGLATASGVVRLSVSAYDAARPSSTPASAIVVVDVVSTNNNAPIFDHSFYNVSIPEAITPGTCIATVRATDPDLRSTITYRLQPQPDEVTINATTGQLCVTCTFSYLTRRTYDFNIVATDNGGLEGVALMQVFVEPANDNRPVFYPAQYTTTMPLGAPLGTYVLSVMARDPDLSIYGRVQYGIVAGSGSGVGYFTIDASAGMLYVSKALVPGKLTVHVSATDGGGLRALADAVVNVTVVGATTFSQLPTFSQTLYKFTVSTNATLGTPVGNVVASLQGMAPDAVITYSLYGGDAVSLFTIDPSLGVVSVAEPLNCVTVTYELVGVMASFSGNPPVIATAQINVTIISANQKRPSFAQSSLTLNLRDTQPVGSTVYIAAAVDPDLGVNGIIRYSLVDPTSTFTINPTTGYVVLSKLLVVGQAKSYVFVIVAQDQGSPPKRSNMTVYVNVIESNNFAPQFTGVAYIFAVAENAYVRSVVGVVSASDGDRGRNGFVTYSLKPSLYSHKFNIDPLKGSMTTAVTLDYERRTQYNLTIVAKDGGVPSKSSSVPVTINVIDENDNWPVLINTTFNFFVVENVPPRSHVGYIIAYDKDPMAVLAYSFVSSSSEFIVDSSSGEIVTRNIIDREAGAFYTMTVAVSDGLHTATATVTVTVLDLNDNSPTFTQVGTYSSSLSVHEPIGTVLVKLTATDPDQGPNGTVTYSIQQVDGSTDWLLFAINMKTGVIVSAAVVDEESKPEYSIVVLATDGGQPRLQTSAVVHINVVQNPDSQLSNVQTIQVVENVNPGTIIGTVAPPSITSKYSSNPPSFYYYVVNGDVFGTFAINVTTGDLYVSTEVDYELCSQYTLKVMMTNTDPLDLTSTMATVSVNVVDVNDNAPTFVLSPAIFTMREKVPIGTAAFSAAAVDADKGPNGRITYAISSQSPSGTWFTIDSSTGMLTVNQLVDWQLVKTIALVVTACDNPVIPVAQLCSSQTVLAIIEDLNDNAPKFVTNMSTVVSVREDAAVGFVVFRVIATDPDFGVNSLISYAIDSGAEDGCLQINSSTGVVSTAAQLNYEAVAQYSLVIAASDSGVPQRTTYATFTVAVINVNDNPPTFTHSLYYCEVWENQPAGTSVVQVQATDLDIGTNLVYYIPPGVAGDMFTVDNTTGEVTTTAPLSWLLQNSWIVTVYVSDASNASQFDRATVLVTVLDQNDNGPVFSALLYSISLPENYPVSSAHTVVATDVDNGINGEFFFTITAGNVDGRFSLDALTGQLTCTALDRELVAFYNLTVTATDRGSPPLSSQTTILVTVLDDNDNTPVFSQPVYTVSLPENSPPGTALLTVTASDSDIGLNALVIYSLAPPSLGHFGINETTGTIFTIDELDAEKGSFVTVWVNANDSAPYGPRSQLVAVNVSVIDVNDNAPIFDQFLYKVTVSLNIAVGQSVVSVHASDADSGLNSQLTYSLSDVDQPSQANMAQYFTIGPSTGLITVARTLPASFTSCVLTVTATDQGTPPLSGKGIVEIDVNTGLPSAASVRFINNTYVASVAENAPYGTFVADVLARVTGSSDHPIYTITSGNENNAFSIDSVTGVITVDDSSQLDYEIEKRLRLIVIAMLTSVNSFDYATVWVNLQDVNDNAPDFGQDRFTTTVYEGNPKGTYVMQLFSVDADSGVNGQVYYSIVGGNPSNAFTISRAVTGIISTNVILDREVQSTYTLKIQASDGGSPSLTSTCTLRINVIDVNDNAPYFPTYAPISVSEGTSQGMNIIQITATDVDLNPKLMYDFMPKYGNPGNMFSIDKYSGWIELDRNLNYEHYTAYELTIRVNDGRNTATTQLIVNVIDLNDNPPVFLHDSYEVSVPELTPVNVPIITVNATDNDSGDNGKLTYSISKGSGFTINSRTGTIYTSQPVTFSPTDPVIYLYVTVRDNGVPQLSAGTDVRVRVIDVNNNPPVFSQQQYRVQVMENAARGTSVLTVSAQDSDSEPRNRLVDYRLATSSSAVPFDVSTSTGDVLVTGVVDYESQSEYTIVVVATDHGSPPLSSSCTLVIDVLDANDHAPIFTSSVFAVSVNESAVSGTTLLQVTATDADTGENARVQYRINSGDDLGAFDIDQDTGVLVLRGSLNYEVTTSYQLVIQAADSSAPATRLSAFATVVVTVTDVNEFPPNFPVFMYIEKIMENLRPGTYVFGAHANDLDKGPFGVVQYSLIGADEMFQIDADSGDVTTLTTFNFMYEKSVQFKVKAMDRGALYHTVSVIVHILQQPVLGPQFTEKRYVFVTPGNGKKGDFVGQVTAVDTAANSTGIVSYALREASDYFAINATTGIVYLLQDLLPGNGSSDAGTGRRKRDLDNPTVSSKVTLIVVASSGFPNPRITEIPVTIDVDRTCPGCSIEPQTTPHSAIPNNGGGLLSGTPLALVIAFVAIAVIFVIAFTIIFVRHKAQKKLASSPSSRYGESTESVDVLPPPHAVFGPPGLNVHRVTFGSVHGNTTTASDPSRSASSGRGSAGDNDDVDDEIRMINATPAQFAQPLVLVPDSGVPHDDDMASENASIMGSVRNHQEYLARLGIHPSTTGHGRINGNARGAGARHTGQQPTGVTAAISVESMHQFSEEGGGEDCGVSSGGGAGPAMSVSGIGMGTVDGEDLDLDGASIAGSSSGAGAGEVMGVGSCTAMTGSLASIVNSEEEFGGSYGWDYLLNWTPQYHPLAQVFAEIGRLKDDVVKPKLAPTLIVPQTPNMRAAGGANQNRGTTAMPPPIITDAPPRALPPSITSPEDQSPFGVRNHLQQQQLAMGQQTPQSNRTSMLTNVSLPMSPISYESTCTSPMMSPSFSPTLSPLANYSPSFSPIVSARGIGSVSSGHASPSTRFDQQLPVDRPQLVMNGQQRQVQETYGVPPSSMYETSQTPMLQHTAVPVPYQTSRQMSTNHVPPNSHMMGGYLAPPGGLNRLANGSARSAGSSTGSDRQSNGNTRHDRQSSQTRSRQDPLTNGNAHGQRRGQTMDQLGSNGVHSYNNNDYTHVPNGHQPYSPHTANSRRYVDESSRDIQI